MSPLELCVLFGLCRVIHWTWAADSKPGLLDENVIHLHGELNSYCQIKSANGTSMTEFIYPLGTTAGLQLYNKHYISKASCNNLKNTSFERKPQVNVINYTFNVTKAMEAQWTCEMHTNFNTTGIQGQENHPKEISQTKICSFNMKVTEPKNEPLIPQKWIYIAVGVIVVVIILGQTGIILYFKSKAHKMKIMRRISQRASANGEDKGRYVTGQQKGKLAVWFTKKRNSKDDDIYETLEELRGDATPPVPPIENIPTLRKTSSPADKHGSPAPDGRPMPQPSSLQRRRLPTPDSSSLQRPHAGKETPDVDITNRPRLPLPTEMNTESKTDTLPKTLSKPGKVKGQVPAPSAFSALKNKTTGAVSMAMVNELDNKLKMRISVVNKPESALLPKYPEKPTGFKRVSFLKKNASKPDSPSTSGANKPFQLPEKPNPMPTGKSAVLLGLSTTPKPMKPTPSVLAKAPPGLIPPVTSPPVNSPHQPTPIPKGPFNKPPQSIPQSSGLPSSVPKKQPIQMMEVPPSRELVGPPSQALLRPRPTAGQPSTVPRPDPKPSGPPPIPKPAILPPGPRAVFKPPLPSPTEEALYMESEEEQIYEEYNEVSPQQEEEPVYNSDDEWTYEHLPNLNIYSS